MKTKALELSEIAPILGAKFDKIKNWTAGRPFKIRASVRQAPRRGMPSLYSIEDIYLMGLALEFSRAGMAAMAIGRLLKSVKARFPQGLGSVEWLTTWRPEGKLKFEVVEGQQPASGASLWHTCHVGDLVRRINEAATA